MATREEIRPEAYAEKPYPCPHKEGITCHKAICENCDYKPGELERQSILLRREEIRETTSQAIRLGICAFQHLGFENLEMYDKIADEVHKAQSRKGIVIKVDRDKKTIRTFLRFLFLGERPHVATIPIKE